MNTQELENNLRQFIGTEKLYRLTTRHLLTDGTMYLAEHAQCYWLMTAVASHLTSRIDDHFAVAKLSVTGTSAVLTLDDGNGRVLDQQHIEYTDFPMTSFQLYACWGGEFWVLMLCSEY